MTGYLNPWRTHLDIHQRFLYEGIGGLKPLELVIIWMVYEVLRYREKGLQGHGLDMNH